jgi:hypothetical protein
MRGFSDNGSCEPDSSTRFLVRKASHAASFLNGKNGFQRKRADGRGKNNRNHVVSHHLRGGSSASISDHRMFVRRSISHLLNFTSTSGGSARLPVLKYLAQSQ